MIMNCYLASAILVLVQTSALMLMSVETPRRSSN